MIHKFWFALFSFILAPLALAPFSLADSSHARIIRLSQVQGDVRFARSFHEDPMTDASAVWERAPLNLPIRQGYALATDEGRAEIEFESGAMLFLNAHSVLEFYDLSLDDGARITRLVLRQGSATVYVNPASGDYFSLTGGDFTAEANGRAQFRLDNFDDGSTLQVEKGKVTAVRNNKPFVLDKGQSYTIHAADASKPQVGRLQDNDDFDSWVSNRLDTVTTATASSTQYVYSPNYTSGFGDLSTYGTWYNAPGYGNVWQPFGASFGWSPFSYGSWYFDQSLGWGFIGSAPWGWLPYHYGGWIFSPVYGWVWAPSGFGSGRAVAYRPVTAVFVRSGSSLGFVPAHPADGHGKTPLNLGQGVYSMQSTGTLLPAIADKRDNWSVVKHAPANALTGTALAAAEAPARVTRSLSSTGVPANHASSTAVGSSIAYDAASHRYINSNNSPAAESSIAKSQPTVAGANTGARIVEQKQSPRVPEAPPSSSRALPTVRPALIPAPARTANAGSHNSSAGAAWGGSAQSGSLANAPASRASAGGAHSSGGSGHH